MAVTVTPVPRNLATKVTFLYMEFEDLFVILGLAVVMNMFGRFLQREMFGIPMNVFLQYVVPVLSIPALILFKCPASTISLGWRQLFLPANDNYSVPVRGEAPRPSGVYCIR